MGESVACRRGLGLRVRRKIGRRRAISTYKAERHVTSTMNASTGQDEVQCDSTVLE